MPRRCAGQVAGAEVTTLATCWRLERTDGWVRGFTDHDRNLVFDGVTYMAATGFLPSAIKSGSDLSVDNLDVDGFLDDEALKAEDLTAGLFDGAKIDIFLVNWADLRKGACSFAAARLARSSEPTTASPPKSAALRTGFSKWPANSIHGCAVRTSEAPSARSCSDP